MASPGKKAFLLRVEPQLWDRVEQLAAQELRSVNAQVEYLLREALARRGRSVKDVRDLKDTKAARGTPQGEP